MGSGRGGSGIMRVLWSQALIEGQSLMSKRALEVRYASDWVDFFFGMFLAGVREVAFSFYS